MEPSMSIEKKSERHLDACERRGCYPITWTYSTTRQLHQHARFHRKASEPVRRGFIGWLAAPVRDMSAVGLILAADEMRRQDELNRTMVKLLAAVIVSLLVILVLA
jgi:hypothetical protein